MATKKAPVRRRAKKEEDEEEKRKEEKEEEEDEEEEEEEGEEEDDEEDDEEDEEEEDEGGKQDDRPPEERAPAGKRVGKEDATCKPPTKDLPERERKKLDKKVREKGETVVPGGTGGKTLDAQERLAEGRCKGGKTRRDQLGREGYQEMGRKGGLSTKDKTPGEREEEEDIHIDESKYRTKNK